MKKESYQIIEKNFRYKLGETDIIAKQNEVSGVH
jgi:Holliday junction resolvase-like predicted endonuclease